MKVFVSHATEDKPFAGLLATKLCETHDVWYDDFVLKVGDSIFESVSRGLRECDYGVVILSPRFFVKKWTRAELDGLFALEEALHKLVLPVWLDVTVAEVRDFSPILADRKGAMASDGAIAVAHALNAAMGASHDARRQESGASALERIARLNSATAEQTRSNHLLASKDGMTRVRGEIREMFNVAYRMTEELTKNGAALGLTFEGGAIASNAWYLNLYGVPHPLNGQLIGRIDWKQPGVDTAAYDTTMLTTCRFASGRDTVVLKQESFNPFITSSDEVIWVNDKARRKADELIRLMHSDFTTQLEIDLSAARRGRAQP